MKASGRLIPRHPHAWGLTTWGPIPGTKCWLLWDGPGSGIYNCPGDPSKPGTTTMIRVRHPAASGEYATLDKAEAAVMAFVRIYLGGEEAGR